MLFANKFEFSAGRICVLASPPLGDLGGLLVTSQIGKHANGSWFAI
jgi:hypothetical protein